MWLWIDKRDARWIDMSLTQYLFFHDRVCTRFSLRGREFEPYTTEREGVDLGEWPQATSGEGS
jgi:hypothetical protein